MTADWLDLEELVVPLRHRQMVHGEYERRDVERPPEKPPSKAALYMRAYRKRMKEQS